jgi:Ran GTPase-activating protein (RanGAP) involved in mRNA processing and transport
LEKLDLSSCFIADEGTIHVANYLENSSIKFLDLRWNKVSCLGSIALSNALEKNETLNCLILKDNKLTYEGVSALLKTKNENLNSLDMRKCSTKDVCYLFKEEVNLKGLYHLDINSCNISDGLVHLTKYLTCKEQRITKLILDFNPLGVSGAKLLKELIENNQNLVLLNIARTNMNDEAIEYIAEGLKKNCTITQLDLQRNQIGDAGATFIAEVLNVNQTIHFLGLRRNIIEDLGAQSIGKALSKNLSLGYLDLAFNNISSLGISELAKGLQSNETIQELNLKNNPIGDFGVIDVFKNMKNIHTLHVNECDLKSESLKSLNSTMTKDLSILKIGGNRIGKSAMLKDCQTVSKWIPSFLDHFNQSKLLSNILNYNLIHLDLSSNQIGDDDLEMLLVAPLLDSKNLFHLNLSLNQISSKGASKISDILKKNESIVTLAIGGNNIYDEGLKEIASGLEKNHTLTALNVDSNFISSKGLECITNVIKNKDSVFSILFACNNNFDDEVVDSLVESISKSESMIMLNLERNKLLTDEGKFKLLCGCAKVSYNAEVFVPFQVYL